MFHVGHSTLFLWLVQCAGPAKVKRAGAPAPHNPHNPHKQKPRRTAGLRFKLEARGSKLLLVHVSHAAAVTAATHRSTLFLFRDLCDECFGGEHE
jgi:hypothetical protein